MIEEKIRQMIEYGKIAGAKNLTPGMSGNLSARCRDTIVITASGTSNAYLEPKDFSVLNFEGKVVVGAKNPSSERMLHVEFYKMRPDINYIMHVHSPYLSTFAACRKALEEPILAENVFYFGGIPLADYALPSSKELVEKTAPYFKDYDAVLLANHGFIVGADSINKAFLLLELAESYAQVVINSKILGGAVSLNYKQVEEIYGLR